MLPVPIKTVITGMRDLMLIPPEEENVQEIKQTADHLYTLELHRRSRPARYTEKIP